MCSRAFHKRIRSNWNPYGAWLTMVAIITSTEADYGIRHLQRCHSWACFLGSIGMQQLTALIGLYLTDVTFCREGNPSHRDSPLVPSKKLLNFNKYHKLARIVQGLSQFMYLRPHADEIK